MSEPKRLDLSASEAEALLERLAQGKLGPEDYEMLGAVVKSWLWLSGVVQDAKVSIRELKTTIWPKLLIIEVWIERIGGVRIFVFVSHCKCSVEN
jgi:hypothetical protein